MNEKQAYNTLVDHFSPPITLSYVVDEEGRMLSFFDFHSQMNDECRLYFHDTFSTPSKEIRLTTDDVRMLGKW